MAPEALVEPPAPSSGDEIELESRSAAEDTPAQEIEAVNGSNDSRNGFISA